MKFLCKVCDYPDLEELVDKFQLRENVIKQRAEFLNKSIASLKEENSSVKKEFWDSIEKILSKHGLVDKNEAGLNMRFTDDKKYLVLDPEFNNQIFEKIFSQ